ncbi:MAG TPA: AraC family transcriptional regulator [Gammaproteobacteria bacterium]|nr:AraC family transcriptional regulator [Gammaproteobacteria bacterium]
MKTLTRLIVAGLLAWPLLMRAAPAAPETTGSTEPAPAPAPDEGVQEKVQDLKKAVLALNRDLFRLEEELLFPSNTQISVFVSMDVGGFFQLDSVKVKLDGKEVANYLYTPREIEALARGGVQRIHIGNIKNGDHELVAFFTGKGPHGRDYKRGANAMIRKGLGPKYVELRIVDETRNQQPEFSIKEW